MLDAMLITFDETARAIAEAARARGARIDVARCRGAWAIGAIGDDDSLDAAIDPSIDRASLGASRAFADAIADREGVLDDAGVYARDVRPPTSFECAAMADVLGDLVRFLPFDRVEIDRTWFRGGLNHCAIDGDVARIRLLESNGTTLAGRTHALVHEMGHALIGLARLAGTSYRAQYGQPDYGRFLVERTFDRVCDEEALVRMIADAWLLRRRAVAWSRTWPGAVDDVARDLDADDLAAFARFRLAQGLGMEARSCTVRRIH
jgi:hypothetical protein